MRTRKNGILFFIPILFLLIAACRPLSVSAASHPVKISKCQLASSSKVSVTATISNTKKVSGSKCYLFALSFSDSGISAKAKPLASVKKAKKMTFSVKLNNGKSSSLLYSRFVIASRNKKGVYKAISDARYLSNPKKAAKYTYKFPTATSKKGLQVSANMLEDAIDLNVRHSTINIVFTELISSSAERNKTFSIPYKYHGKTYWFRKALVNSYDAQLTALKENNVIVSAILLLGWRSDLKSLIYPSGRKAGHAFYAWNTENASAREQLQATLSFLASRYGTSAAKHGRIVNWIVGNEVNNYNTYNYAGKKTLKQYAKIYANAFRMTYNTVTSIYANARVYISLDHLWNTRVSGSFTSREMLDTFASTLKSQGNVSWNLAYHPYGSPLTEPKFWANVNGQTTQALTSPVINMANLDVLTSYIRQKYGSKTRIILSEQGYTSVRHITVRVPKDTTDKTDQNDTQSKTDPQKTTGTTQKTDPQGTTDTTQKTDPQGTTGSAQKTDPQGTTDTTQKTDPQGTTGSTQKTDPQGTGDSTQKTDPQEMVTVHKKVDAQKEQSAAIAYSYYLAESNDMIDSFIMNRHVDHQAEIDQGLDLGLWTTDASSSLPEWADAKKDSWQVFKFMDSNKAQSVTADSLSVIGITKWADVIPGYSTKLYRKNIYSSAVLNQVGSYKKSAPISKKWKAYGAASSGTSAKSTVTVRRKKGQNRNSLWGFSQTFSKDLKFSSAPYFYTTVKVHGAAAAKACVTIRFCSGKNILECSRIVSCDKSVRLGVSLKKWNCKNAVKKIQVFVSPVSGGWTGDAYVTMKYPVRGK